jgi:hypothetical protein
MLQRLLLPIVVPLVVELAHSLHTNPTATMSHTQFLVTCTSVTHDYQANLNSYIKCVCHTRTCSAICDNEEQLVLSNLITSVPSKIIPFSDSWSATRVLMCLFQRSTIICLKASGRAVQRVLGNVPGSGNALVMLRVHALNNSNKRSDLALVTVGRLARLGLGPGVPRLPQAWLITGMFKGTRF